MTYPRQHYSTAPKRQVRPAFLAVAVLVALALTLWSLQ
jgi:hypothetical protein